jgi:hypothetical protein
MLARKDHMAKVHSANAPFESVNGNLRPVKKEGRVRRCGRALLKIAQRLQAGDIQQSLIGSNERQVISSSCGC